MTQEELKRRDLNLTKSALNAKKYYVRGMVGHTESDEGFMPIEAIPVFNPIKNQNTPLAEVLEDVGNLNTKLKDLQSAHASLEKEYNEFKQATVIKERDLQNQINKLINTDVQELRIVITSLADRLQKLEDETDII